MSKFQDFIDKYRNASRPDIDYKIDYLFSILFSVLLLVGAYNLMTSDSSVEYISYINHSINHLYDGQGYVMLMYNSLLLGLTSGFIVGSILIYMFISRLIVNRLENNN